MNYFFAWFNKIIASIRNIKKGNQAPIKGENEDFVTNTPNIFSKKIKINPSAIPKAKLIPIPPLLLNEETETAIRVKTNEESGILHLLCLTNKWVFIRVDPLSNSSFINLFNSLKFKVSAL